MESRKVFYDLEQSPMEGATKLHKYEDLMQKELSKNSLRKDGI